MMRPEQMKEKQYGYWFNSFLTGKVTVERSFDTREEMEASLAEELDPNTLMGSIAQDVLKPREA